MKNVEDWVAQPHPEDIKYMEEKSAELRRLHEVNQELVEALEQLLDDMGKDGLSVCKAAKDLARAAIAKAKGESNV